MCVCLTVCLKLFAKCVKGVPAKPYFAHVCKFNFVISLVVYRYKIILFIVDQKHIQTHSNNMKHWLCTYSSLTRMT